MDCAVVGCSGAVPRLANEPAEALEVGAGVEPNISNTFALAGLDATVGADTGGTLGVATAGALWKSSNSSIVTFAQVGIADKKVRKLTVKGIRGWGGC